MPSKEELALTLSRASHVLMWLLDGQNVVGDVRSVKEEIDRLIEELRN